MKKISILIVALFFIGIGTGKAQYSVLHNFDSLDGLIPVGSLTLSGNVLYGSTYYGGSYSWGNIFSIKTDGSGYTDLLDFNQINRGLIYGSLTVLGGKIYAATEFGGANQDGSIFCMNIDGSNFKDLFDCSHLDEPASQLVSIGNKLYGSAWYGGLYNYGYIYSIDTDGSNYRIIISFDSVHGESPFGALTLSGKVFYGVTSNGGANGGGVVFSVDTDGANYKDLYDLSWYTGSASLVYSAGELYVVTGMGGANYVGSIFRIDANGNNYKKLMDFDSAHGVNPYGQIIRYGNTLYGTTIYGGPNDSGCIFSIDTDGTGFTQIYNFGPVNGSEPVSGVIFSGGVLYGTTFWGGTYSDGVIYGSRICSNPYDEPICIATLDTASNKNKIIWGRTNPPPAGSSGNYNIYKDTGSGFVLIHSQPLDSLSQYIDITYNAGPASYEISTVDSCGESALSAPHTTIYLTTTAAVNAFILNWTGYVGFTPTMYRIFRGPSLSSLVEIDSVSSATFTYTDSFPPLNSYYAVEAVKSSGPCIPTRHSVNNVSSQLSGSFSNGFNTATLGVQKIGAGNTKLTIYPNPSNGTFTVKLSHPEIAEASEIKIYDILGEQVYDAILNLPTGGQGNNAINLSNQPNGIYFYHITSADGSLMWEGKLVIQK